MNQEIKDIIKNFGAKKHFDDEDDLADYLLTMGYPVRVSKSLWSCWMNARAKYCRTIKGEEK
jgi:hypothetical protein